MMAPPGPAAGRAGDRHRRAGVRVRPDRRPGPGGARAGPPLGRRADARPLAARRHPPAHARGRPGGRRRPASASAASSTGRSSTCRRSAGSTSRPGRIVVSNRPESAAAIERAHSDGHGLLAHHGSSYGNLFSGDAERAVLTMSGAGRRKEGRIGAGYVGYFSRPQQATRTLIAVVAEIARERRAARLQRRRDVEPRVDRGWDVRPAAGVHDGRQPRRVRAGRDQRRRRGPGGDLRRPARLRRGRPPLRARAGRRARRAARPRPPDRPHRPRRCTWAPRPYHLVVLSDHGQTQGATFRQRNGETLAELVARLCGGADVGRRRRRARAHRVDRVAAPRPRPRTARAEAPAPAATDGARVRQPRPRVAARARRRLTREEIDARYPALIAGLVDHPDIGFVLVGAAAGLARARRRPASATWRRARSTATTRSPRTGRDAVAHVAEVDAYRTAADLMVNARYDPEHRRGLRLRGAGRLARRARRAADPPVRALPGGAVGARRADRHVGRVAPRAQDVARRGRSAGAPPVARGSGSRSRAGTAR